MASSHCSRFVACTCVFISLYEHDKPPTTSTLNVKRHVISSSQLRLFECVHVGDARSVRLSNVYGSSDDVVGLTYLLYKGCVKKCGFC